MPITNTLAYFGSASLTKKKGSMARSLSLSLSAISVSATESFYQNALAYFSMASKEKIFLKDLGSVDKPFSKVAIDILKIFGH
jgi:hypothetical protein